MFSIFHRRGQSCDFISRRELVGVKGFGAGVSVVLASLAIFALSFSLTDPLYSQAVSQQDRKIDKKVVEEVYSGPQPGEKLPPLKVHIVIGDGAGEDVDIVSARGKNPTFLIFMNAFGERVNEMMRMITLYAERRNNPELVRAVVWLTSDPSEMKTKLKRAQPNMPKNTPVAVSQDGLEGPGAYGLNRHVQMTVLIAKNGVVTSNFALVQPSIQGDSVAVSRELVKVVGGKPPTLADILTPRRRQFVADRINQIVDKSTSDDKVRRMARSLENYVRTRRQARIKLGEVSNEFVKSGRFNDRKQAIGYLRKWAKEHRQNP